MNEKELSLSPGNNENDADIKLSDDRLRDGLGLPHNATSEEVFATLAQQNNLSSGLTPEEIIFAMMNNNFNTDLNEFHGQLKQKTEKHRRSLLGQMASFFVLRK